MAENDSPQTGGQPLAPAEAPRASPVLALLRPAAIGFFALSASLAAGVAAIAFFGSASDGSPTVSIRLMPAEPTVAEDGGAPQAKSFLAPRTASGHLVADPELIEDSFEGPLPKLGPDGRAPMEAYAMPFDKNNKRPKIAIVIGGLGVGAAATDVALKMLPPQVTLAFVPYGKTPQADVDRARGSGHEVLLQVPMEPFDFPNSDPGPHVLLVSASHEENIKRFQWALSRFTGYAGFSNLLGGRFLGEAGAIEPVLAEGAKRGLLFFDTGASSRSLAATAARHARAAIATGTLLLDEVPTQAAIDNKLVQLEKEAKGGGFAIGVGSLYPVTIARVAEWATGAGERGFQIVAVSALAAKPEALASASAH